MTAAGAAGSAGYLGYSRDELDALYDTSRRVSDLPEYLRRFEERSTAVRREWAAQLDVAYGDHPRERLDVFPAARPDAPVLIFFHGG
jgi:arylformamidase